ncbi:MAG: hypothetical protein JWN14_3030 [Chthonomonadales bacterium]|nr:hypothetical protein [Chthonomonadales bacterium]
MTETDPNPLPLLPDNEEFAASHQRRVHLFTLMTGVLAFLSAITVFALGVDSLAPPFLILIALLVLIVVWNYPTATFYMLVVASTICEVNPNPRPDAIVERIPFFWNINTAIQVYTHHDFKALPLNMMEALIFLTITCMLIKAAFDHKGKLILGPIFWPIVAYICFVIFAWVNGMTSGGDFKISLQEVRPQFYFLMTYLLAVNTVKTPRDVNRLYWIIVLGIGLKGIIYTIRRYTLFAGHSLPDGGVGSHEEAFLFDCFEVLLMVLSFTGVQKRLRTLMWFLLPFVVMGNLATNRRAGTAAIIMVFPVLLLSAYRVLPNRRKMIAIFSLVAAILGPMYYMTFRHSNSMIAQPARAIASQFEANARDAGSNAYRDAENADLMATVKLSPLTGFGYGKKMMHVAVIADISMIYDWWDIITHNQVLWVWMRVGTFGMLAFWMMICSIIITAGQTIRAENATIELKVVGIFAMLIVCMLLFFGLLDLGFANYRDMLFCGCWAGVLAAAPKALASASSLSTTDSAPEKGRVR